MARRETTKPMANDASPGANLRRDGFVDLPASRQVKNYFVLMDIGRHLEYFA